MTNVGYSIMTFYFFLYALNRRDSRLTGLYCNSSILVHQRSNGSRCCGFENRSLPHNEYGTRCIASLSSARSARIADTSRPARLGFAVRCNCTRSQTSTLRRAVACLPLVSSGSTWTIRGFFRGGNCACNHL